MSHTETDLKRQTRAWVNYEWDHQRGCSDGNVLVAVGPNGRELYKDESDLPHWIERSELPVEV